MSTHLRALWLAWGAVVALLAYPSHARVLGQQTGIMGSEHGVWRPASTGSVTIAAMPYARTVTCSSYTLTGTFTGSTPTWSASPSGASGSCSDTGGGTFSCVVDVDPDATGEGVETITVSNGASDTETIGFYVDGEHSCFLAQSVNGNYNVGLSNLDAVATWENLGSSALDITQGTASAQPTFRTSIVGGQPIVRCDGGDRLAAATASDWTFLHNGTGSTVDAAILATSGATTNTIAATSTGAGTNRGIGWRTVATAATSFFLSDGTALRINASSANNAFTANTFNNHLVTLASADTPDHTQYVNNASVQSGDSSAAFSALAPANPLSVCATPAAASFLTGDVFRLLAYPSSLTSTQRAINKAVDEWALGASYPVTP